MPVTNSSASPVVFHQAVSELAGTLASCRLTVQGAAVADAAVMRSVPQGRNCMARISLPLHSDVIDSQSDPDRE